MHTDLKLQLQSQLNEYEQLETAARSIAYVRGWELSEISPAIQPMVKLSARMKLSYRNHDSQIAQMVIKGNTMGMIKSLKNLHRISAADASVHALSKQLLCKEKENIEQMQGFV